MMVPDMPTPTAAPTQTTYVSQIIQKQSTQPGGQQKVDDWSKSYLLNQIFGAKTNDFTPSEFSAATPPATKNGFSTTKDGSRNWYNENEKPVKSSLPIYGSPK